MSSFIKYCFNCLIIPIIIVTINLIIDYRQLINPYSSFIQRMVNNLENNNLVYNMDILPERRIVKKRIETTVEGLNNICIGSSTTMLIGKETGFNYINFGVSGMVMEDMSFLYELISHNNITIDTLIIGLNPWFLNKNHGELRYHQFDNSFSKSDLRSLVSLRYLYENIKINKYEIWNGDTTKHILLSDGSIKYSLKYRNKRWENKEFITNYLEGIYRYNNFNHIDSNYLINFEKLIYQFNNLSSHTILILTPYHPLIFDDLLLRNS